MATLNKCAISVIVPVYKIKYDLLRACLDSLSRQTNDNYNVVLVDDGSPDKCADICDEYANTFDNFAVIHQENKGVSVARNTGIHLSESEWIAFVDPDDWVEPNYIQCLIDNVRNDMDILLFDYWQEFESQSLRKTLPIGPGVLNPDFLSSLRLAPFNQLLVEGRQYEYETNTIWNKLYRRDFIDCYGLQFDDEARKGQDVIFNAEALLDAGNIAYLNESLYHYRYLSTSVTNRYNPKVSYYNEIAFEHYERLISDHHLGEEYFDAYYVRVVTRLYSCLRLYYFHPDCPLSFADAKKSISEMLKSSPYREALLRVKYSRMTTDQSLFCFVLRRRWFYLLKLMVSGRQTLKSLLGRKLA